MSGGTPRTVVIGGGFAGIAAAVDLAGRGAEVLLLEARNRAGGRASSFPDPESGETIDNGQHLLMGCYRATRDLLRRLGTEHLVRFQKRLSLVMLLADGRAVRLACTPLPSPLHLLAGLLVMKGLRLSDKLALLRSAPSLMHLSGDGLTVEDWLDRLRQTEMLREIFWRPLAVAALNEDTRLAGAALLVPVMREAFGGGVEASGLGLPAAGLSDLYVGPATRYIRERGGEIRTGALVERIRVEEGRVTSVEIRGGDGVPCGSVVVAVPHIAAARLLPEEALGAEPRLRRLEELGSSAIVSVNLWLDRTVIREPLVGLQGGTVQFIFNKQLIFDGEHARGSYLACVMSAASGISREPNEPILESAVQDLRRYLPAARSAKILRSMVVREKQGTFSGRPEVLALRPPVRTSIPNLALAGDWTDTGLPGTIEGAVRSGFAAASLLRPL